MKYQYTLDDTGTHDINIVGDSVERLNKITAPGLEWLKIANTMNLYPDFMIEGNKLAGRWNKHDVESYGVTFDKFEQFINSLGYEVVYGQGT